MKRVAVCTAVVSVNSLRCFVDGITIEVSSHNAKVTEGVSPEYKSYPPKANWEDHSYLLNRRSVLQPSPIRTAAEQRDTSLTANLRKQVSGRDWDAICFFLTMFFHKK